METKEPVQLVLNGTVIKSIAAEDTILVHVKNSESYTNAATYRRYIKLMISVVEDLTEAYNCAVIMVLL